MSERDADWRTTDVRLRPVRSGSTAGRRRRGRASGSTAPAAPPAARTAAGVWARGPVALGHRRLSIIDLSVAGSQPMVDSPLGLTVVFNGCIYNYQQLRAELEGHGHRFFSTSDTEVIGKAYAAVGPGLRRPLLRHVRVRDRRARDRPADPRPGPARHQAALPRPDARAAAVRLDAAGAAGRRRHRHLDRPDRAGLLHDLPLRGAGAADDPERHPQAAAGHGPGRRARRTSHIDHVYWEPEFSRDPRPRRLDRAGLAGRAAGLACGRRSTGGWSPTCRSGVLLSGGIDSSPGGGAAGRGRPDRPADLQHRLRLRRRRVGRRVRVLEPGGRALRHRPPPDPDRQLAGCCPASTRPSRR